MIKLWNYTEYNNWDSQRYDPLSSTLPESIWMIFTSELTQWGNVLLGCQILYRYWTLSYTHNLISVEMKIEFVESYVLFTYYCKHTKETKIWNSCPTLHHLSIIHDEIQQHTSSLNDVSSHNSFWDLTNWSDFRDLSEQLKVFIVKDDDVAANSIQKYIQIIHHEWSALKFNMTHLQKNVSQYWFCKFWLKK